MYSRLIQCVYHSVQIFPAIKLPFPALRFFFFFCLAPAAILYYDYALTLATEIERFWPPKRRLGWASCTFLINRYISVVGHVPVFAQSFLMVHKDKVIE